MFDDNNFGWSKMLGHNFEGVKKKLGTQIWGGQQFFWTSIFGGQKCLVQKVWGPTSLMWVPKQNVVHSLWEMEDPLWRTRYYVLG